MAEIGALTKKVEEMERLEGKATASTPTRSDSRLWRERRRTPTAIPLTCKKTEDVLAKPRWVLATFSEILCAECGGDLGSNAHRIRVGVIRGRAWRQSTEVIEGGAPTNWEDTWIWKYAREGETTIFTWGVAKSKERRESPEMVVLTADYDANNINLRVMETREEDRKRQWDLIDKEREDRVKWEEKQADAKEETMTWRCECGQYWPYNCRSCRCGKRLNHLTAVAQTLGDWEAWKAEMDKVTQSASRMTMTAFTPEVYNEWKTVGLRVSCEDYQQWRTRMTWVHDDVRTNLNLKEFVYQKMKEYNSASTLGRNISEREGNKKCDPKGKNGAADTDKQGGDVEK